MGSFDFAGSLGISNLSEYQKLVDGELAKVLITNNAYLKLPLKQLKSKKSKRLRSTLVIATVLCLGKAIDEVVIRACVAVELLHLASLVHDDILDNADLRSGQPSLSSQGLNQAIIVGDYLFALATRQAAQIDPLISQEITKAYTSMCYGQALELADQFNLKRTESDLLKAIEGKTAALISAALLIGGLCAEARPSQLKALAQYGLNFGISFQLIDDLMDLLSSQKILGKPTANDIKQGIYTLPLIFAFNNQDSTANKKMLAQPTELITQDLISNGSIQKSIKLIESYNKSAIVSLAKLSKLSHRAELAKLPATYWHWAFHNQVLPIYHETIK